MLAVRDENAGISSQNKNIVQQNQTIQMDKKKINKLCFAYLIVCLYLGFH